MTHRSSQSRISICMWEDPRTTWRTGQTSWLVRTIALKHLDLFGYHSISYLSQSRVLQKCLQITQSFSMAKAMNTSAACASSCTVCPRVPSWVRRAKMQQRPCLHPRHLWRNAWKSVQGKGGVIPQSHAEFLGLLESMQCPSQTSTSLWRDFHSVRNHPEPGYLWPPFAKWPSRSVATCNPAVKQNLAVCEALHSTLSYPTCKFLICPHVIRHRPLFSHANSASARVAKATSCCSFCFVVLWGPQAQRRAVPFFVVASRNGNSLTGDWPPFLPSTYQTPAMQAVTLHSDLEYLLACA